MFRIRISANQYLNNSGYRSAEIELPANKASILDAFDLARIPYGSGEYQLESKRCAPAFVRKVLDNTVYNPSIAEMNHLAERMVEISEDERDMLDGIMEIRGSYNIMDAINATHNLHGFEYHPCATNDIELGEIAIDNGFPVVENVPEDLLSCLDPEKVGALMRSNDHGVFTKCGYLVPDGCDWEEAYDGQSLSARSVTLESNDPIISLLFYHNSMPIDETQNFGASLNLPATNDTIRSTLALLGTDSFDNCDWINLESVIPTFKCDTMYQASVDELNILAEAIKTHCGAQLAKYKAVCDLEDVIDVKTAIRITERLDEYDFIQLTSTETFGRAAFTKSGNDINLAEGFGFDFDAYGHKMMQEQNIRSTCYGFISHPRGQEQAAVMAEPEEVTIEPTMGI